MRWPLAAGVVLLAAEAGLLILNRSTCVCWTPFQERTRYSIDVSVGGEGLTEEQIESRYRRLREGIELCSAGHLFDAIRRAEEKFEKWGRSRVVVRYSVNGGPYRLWRYPEP